MDCTVVSFLPIAIPGEQKPGLYPGSFAMKASDGKRPELLHVGDSITYVYLDENRGSLPVRVAADEVSRSIVEDFNMSVPNYLHGIASPGLFWIHGKKTVDQIFRDHKEECMRAQTLQRNWFIELVKDADDNWEKFKQYKMISALHRFACDSIGEERAWNIEASAAKNSRCPACQTVVSIEAVICATCRFVLNEEAYTKMKFAQEK